MKCKLVASLLLTALSVTLASSAMASTIWYVNGVSGSDSNTCTKPTSACKTIKHTISLAASSDTISVAAATYTENLNISISLKILGSGASATIIDGGGVNRVVYVSNNAAQVTLSGVTIRHGSVSYGYGGTGAGIFNSGTLNVIASTISGNLASIVCPVHQTCNAAGGGIYNAAILTISKSTITGNTVRASCPLNPCVANADGGGIYNHGVMSISNSTLSGNIASHLGVFGFGRGGAISNRGTANISNSTLAGNSANSGSGINNYVGYSVALQNSLVANSSSGGNCLGTMTSNGYNLSSDGTCSFANTGDMNNTDPMLGQLQNNGGTTQTMALPSGSPAIDAGNPSGCTDGQGNLLKTDQRGAPRPDSEDAAGCDIGAYESQGVQ